MHWFNDHPTGEPGLAGYSSTSPLTPHHHRGGITNGF